LELRTAHLFSGIEGFRYGLERSSQSTTNNQGGTPQRSKCTFHTVYSNDFNKYACAISRYNYPDGTTHEADIGTVDAASIPDHDLLTFGWPCQDNSIAGKRRGQREGTRSGMLSEAIIIIRAKKPQYFIAENVPGLFSVNGGCDFYQAIGLFTDAGYDVQWQVFNTRWFPPQNRERIYFIGHLRGERRPQILPFGETGQTYSGGTVKAVVNCLDSNYGKGWLDHGQRTMIGINRIQFDATGKGYDSQQDRIYLVDGISPSIPSTRTENKLTILENPHGFNKGGFQNEPCLREASRTNTFVVKRQPLKFLGRNQRNIEGDYAYTVDGSGTNGVSVRTARTDRSGGTSSPFGSKQNWDTYLIDGAIRKLTPVECERLQGFPDNWTRYGIDKNGRKIEISDTQRYKCCGNAVSTVIPELIGKLLLADIESNR
jgi:DNA (cytosine-5)-methyltransferase 1